MSYEYPTLYKKTKTGAVQVCKISVHGDTYFVDFGQLNGKMQQNHTTCTPKNVGRANETTPELQALNESLAKWESKVKGGYSESIECDSEVLLPQKVKVYQDNKKSVIFPCYASPKLNGVNGEYRLVSDELKLYSRGGNEYPIIEHHVERITALLKDIGTDSINGEIYIHGEHLQDITGAVKKFKSHITPRLEFRSFDLPNLPGDYATRQSFLNGRDPRAISAVTLNSHEEIEDYHNRCVSVGYEGIVIRNAKGMYKYNERSSDVFKFKIALDAEFKCVGYKLDKAGHAVFECTTHNEEHNFSVKLKGTANERLAMAAEADDYIGQWLKLEYETLSKDLKPLKPVGIMFRQCDTDGNPVE